MIEDEVLVEAVMQSCDGVVVTERQGDQRIIVFVNEAFTTITGYEPEEALGRDSRFLQMDDREQPQAREIAEALNEERPVLTTLRNYCKDGSLFWNELSISPLRNANGQVTHYLNILRDVTDRVEQERKIRLENEELRGLNLRLQKESEVDAVTAIYNREVLETRVSDLWKQAKRNGLSVSLFFMDVDELMNIRETHGEEACGASLRQVAQRLGRCFQRATELLFRFNDSEFVAIAIGEEASEVKSKAQSILENFRSRALNFEKGLPVTMSIGLLHMTPGPDESLDLMMRNSRSLMYEAKNLGGDCMVSNLDATGE